MFRIGDFSKIGQVSVRMLRHYDKLGLLTPQEIDRFTSYRYYTIDQLPRLNRILALKDLGLSLEQIKHLLDEDVVSPERLRGMLLIKQVELEQELKENQRRLGRVEARLQRMEQEDEPSPYEVVIKSVDPITVASTQEVVPTIDEVDFYCASLGRRLYQELAQADIEPGHPEITRYHTGEYRETDIDMEVSVAVDKNALLAEINQPHLAIDILPAEEMVAALIYEGTYRGVTEAILALLTWVGTNHHTSCGPLRELHHSGRAHQNGKLVEPAILELQLPIQKL